VAKLLLIRHGQTKLHQDDRFWGKTDVELSDVGIMQAKQLHDKLAGEKIDAICSSTLKRAVATAKIIAAGHKVKITTFNELCECSFGYAEGLTYTEISRKYPELAEELSNGTAVDFPGGESLQQLNQRVKAFTEKLKHLEPQVTVAVVSHGGPIRLMICNLLGMAVKHWLQLRVDRASLSVVETYDGKAILTLLNDVSHLKS
jgi:alpha-ribazole phosphatase